MAHVPVHVWGLKDHSVESVSPRDRTQVIKLS